MDSLRPTRPSRLRLYLPFGLLVLVLAAWSAGWFVVRARVFDETAAWRAREAQAGRIWTCPNERIGGFPFRIELRCDAPTLSWGPEQARITARLGGLTVVSQVYQPRVAILEAAAPFAIRFPDGDGGEARWTSLRASLHASGADRIERLSVLASEVDGRISLADGTQDSFALGVLDIQGRPHPQRFETDRTVELAVTAQRARLPLVDAFTGEAATSDASLVAAIAQAPLLVRGAPVEALEAWRNAGGRLMVSSLSIAKGDRRLEAMGEIGLDAFRRPEGRLDLSARGLDDLVTGLMGGNQRGAALIMGGLSLLARPAPAPSPTGSALKPLPSLTFQDGRILVGPFPVGSLRPVY